MWDLAYDIVTGLLQTIGHFFITFVDLWSVATAIVAGIAVFFLARPGALIFSIVTGVMVCFVVTMTRPFI